VNEEELDAALEASTQEDASRQVTTESTGTYAGQRADVIIERWLQIEPDPMNEGGVIATPRLSVEVKYDGFDGIAAFPYQDVDHVLSDLTGNHYQRMILTERRELAGVDMPEEDFSAAITQIEADAEAIIRQAFDR
jgi:phosphoglycolate phosphatase-like HAD superfamily hydrolase